MNNETQDVGTLIDMTDPVKRTLVQFITLRSELQLAMHGIKAHRRSRPVKDAEYMYRRLLGEKANFRTYRQAYEWVVMFLEDNGIPTKRRDTN